MSLTLAQIADLAKQGGRLASEKQWILADALAGLTETDITTIAINSKRNESTLHQYARAAERWPEPDRVTGVSFSAHRVALSWHDPRGLLVDLKQQYGSPTVRQVRQAMGLEGHPALELVERGIRKLDRKVSVQALRRAILKLLEFEQELDPGTSIAATTGYGDLAVADMSDKPTFIPDQAVDEEIDRFLEEDERVEEVVEPEPEDGRWTPPIRTTDLAGI